MPDWLRPEHIDWWIANMSPLTGRVTDVNVGMYPDSGHPDLFFDVKYASPGRTEPHTQTEVLNALNWLLKNCTEKHNVELRLENA